jgi:hypothetical protein
MNDDQRGEGLAEVERLNRAYAQVFGEDGKRSTAQQAVWDDLASGSFEFRSLVVPNPSGMIDPLRVAWNDGRRSMFLYVRESIRRATTPAEPKTVTVKKD